MKFKITLFTALMFSGIAFAQAPAIVKNSVQDGTLEFWANPSGTMSKIGSSTAPGALTWGLTSGAALTHTFQSGDNTTLMVNSGGNKEAVSTLNSATDSFTGKAYLAFQKGGTTQWKAGMNADNAVHTGGKYFFISNAAGNDVLAANQAGKWRLGSEAQATTQSNAVLSIRGTIGGNSLEWGHSNGAGYGHTLGVMTGGGAGFLGFNTEAGTTGNTFMTRGNAGSAIISANGGFSFATIPAANADNQTAVTIGSANSAGSWSFGNATNGSLFVLGPAAASRITVNSANGAAQGFLEATSTNSEVNIGSLTNHNVHFYTNSTIRGEISTGGAWTFGQAGFAGEHRINGVINSAANGGSGSALPSLPAGYLRMNINGTVYRIPVYN